MKSLNIFVKFILFLPFLFSMGVTAQVVIGDTSIDDGATFQLKSANKGLLIPNVSLTSRNDITTVNPALVEGLWVYNTANAGSGLDRVSPGFYFWDSSKWIRMYNEGYTKQFEQTAPERSLNTSDTYTIPGLNQTIEAPYTGTYEIHVTGYLASQNFINGSNREATVVGSYMLEIDNVKVAESMVSSNTKRTPDNAFQALGRQTTMVYHVDLAAGVSYNFKVRARLWQYYNAANGGLSACGISDGYCFWGICSGPYNGNAGLTDNAQDAYLTITLLRQY